MAFWLEKNHGEYGGDHIAEQVSRLAKSGDADGIRLWRLVAERYDQLLEQRTAH